jgi:hypothetical protein
MCVLYDKDIINIIDDERVWFEFLLSSEELQDMLMTADPQ